MHNKTIFSFGFCDIHNNQGLGKGYHNHNLDLDYSWYLKNLIQWIFIKLLLEKMTSPVSIWRLYDYLIELLGGLPFWLIRYTWRSVVDSFLVLMVKPCLVVNITIIYWFLVSITIIDLFVIMITRNY